MSNAIIRNTLTNQVTEQMREDILLCKFPLGTHITTQLLAERYNTSPAPIREALQILAGEKLLSISPYKGAVITMIDHQFINSMYDILRSMEVLLVENIVDHWTPEFREKIISIHYQIAALSLEEAYQNFNTLNRLFHDSLEQFSANQQAYELCHQYHRNITILTDNGLPHTQQRYQAIIKEHAQIIEAIDSGDVDEVRKQYQHHSLAAQKEMFRQLKDR